MTLPKHSLKRELDDLRIGLHRLQVNICASSFDRFKRYIQLLHEHKPIVHLLSHGDYDYIAQRHILVSLMGFHVIHTYATICDVGAGAGFPSIPLSVCMPTSHFTLFESKAKKAEFLRTVISRLQLKNVEVIQERAELHQGAKFEVILLKAVGKIRDLVKTVDRLMEPRGCAVFYKTQHVETEIKQAQKILNTRGFSVQIEKLKTPIEQKPLALAILRKGG